MEKMKVLLADDEPDIVLILKRYLTLDGYDVAVSVNGKDALEKALSAPFDLFIFDVMMPEMNGWEVCRKVKENPATKDIPVIVLTAKSQNTDAVMSYECGADEYATKPFDYPQLSETIKRLLKEGKS